MFSGSTDGSSFLPSMLAFDPAANTWESVGSALARDGVAAVTINSKTRTGGMSRHAHALALHAPLPHPEVLRGART